MPDSIDAIRKICCICDANVAGAKRWKDQVGKYYCDPCWQKTSSPAGANPSSSSLPSNSDELSSLEELGELAVATEVSNEIPQSIRCAGCREMVPRDLVHKYEGRPYCFACVSDLAEATSPTSSASMPPLEASPSYDLIETRRCPVCNEQIQASAKKCKHCGEWLQRTSGVATIQFGQRVGRRSSGPARSYLNSAILTLILYVIGFGVVGLITNIVFLSSAKRTEAETGETPEGKGCLVALLWVFVWIPLILAIPGIIIVLLIANHSSPPNSVERNSYSTPVAAPAVENAANTDNAKTAEPQTNSGAQPQSTIQNDVATTEASPQPVDDPEYQRLHELWLQFANAQAKTDEMENSYNTTRDQYNQAVSQGASENETHWLSNKSNDLKQKYDDASAKSDEIFSRIGEEYKKNSDLVIRVAKDIVNDPAVAGWQKEVIRKLGKKSSQNSADVQPVQN